MISELVTIYYTLIEIANCFIVIQMRFILFNLLNLLKFKDPCTEDESLIYEEGKKLPVQTTSLQRWFTVFSEDNWLGPGIFIIDLACEKKVKEIEIINAHKDVWDNASTKEFQVSVGNDTIGPWDEVVHEVLQDSRDLDKVPLEKFSFDERIARYLKFEMVSFYGKGGGLQYFAHNGSGTWITKIKLFSEF